MISISIRVFGRRVCSVGLVVAGVAAMMIGSGGVAAAVETKRLGNCDVHLKPEVDGPTKCPSWVYKGNLSDLDLTGAILTNAKLSGYITRTKFINADLSHADLSNTNAFGAKFKGADMSMAIVTKMIFSQGGILPEDYSMPAYRGTDPGTKYALFEDIKPTPYPKGVHFTGCYRGSNGEQLLVGQYSVHCYFNTKNPKSEPSSAIVEVTVKPQRLPVID